MANLLDYLDWRGDLTLEHSPFNEVDNLILSELSFVDFSGIVPPPGEGEAIPLWRAAQAFFAQFAPGEAIDMGVLVPGAILDMLRRMADSRRFSDMKLLGCEDYLDPERSAQFAALSIDCGDGALYLAFRGTDDTLAGWKEDFNIACLPVTPAQGKALAYTKEIASLFPELRLRLGGHSKGGNLAVWSAVFAPEALQQRLDHVWSNDGPGFREDIHTTPEYLRIQEKITVIVPKSSVVGLLLEHPSDYEVVDSLQIGLLQHDGFSWEVRGNRFVHLGSVSRQGHINDLALREWVRGMTQEQREKFIDGLFRVLTASGARTLTELKEDGLKAAASMIQAMKDMDKDTRDALSHAIGLLFLSNFRVRMEDWQKELAKFGQETGRFFQSTFQFPWMRGK